MAPDASKATYEDQVRTILTITATNVELTVTIKQFTDKIITLSEKLAAAAKSNGRGGSVPPGFDNDGSKTLVRVTLEKTNQSKPLPASMLLTG